MPLGWLRKGLVGHEAPLNLGAHMTPWGRAEGDLRKPMGSGGLGVNEVDGTLLAVAFHPMATSCQSGT